jgi:hypothetical protein
LRSPPLATQSDGRLLEEDLDYLPCKEEKDPYTQESILRMKYSKCYQEYQRNNDAFIYYKCMDRGLISCGLEERFVKIYQTEKKRNDRGDGKLEEIVNGAVDLHSCEKKCVDYAYGICVPLYKGKSEMSSIFHGCVQKYKKNCDHLCYTKYSIYREFTALQELGTLCAKELALSMVDICRLVQFSGKENTDARQNCIKALSVFAQTKCSKDDLPKNIITGKFLIATIQEGDFVSTNSRRISTLLSTTPVQITQRNIV